MPEKPISLRQLTDNDLPKIAEQICVEYRERKERRKDLEKHWKEIDRQLRMEPELSHKKTRGGDPAKGSEWLPEIELPLQAQTLEVLLGDVTRFKFPKGRDWFRCTAAMTDQYLQSYRSVETPIPGEKGPDLDQITQENIDRIAQAIPSHFHRQYPFRQHVKRVDVEALKYGFGVGRVREVSKRMLGHTVKQKTLTQKIPMFLPCSAKTTYLDDSAEAVMHEGQMIGPNIIQCKDRKLDDIRLAAKGDESWIKSQIERLTADKNGCVKLVELEGDIVYSTSRETIVARNVIVTAAFQEGSDTMFGLVREQTTSESTYIVFDYHHESADSIYATAPLMKGLPIQKMDSLVTSQLMASGQLKIQPPVSYDGDDAYFKSMGGPVVAPQAQWETIGDINVHDEVGGDPSVFFAISQGFKQLYNDVTGGHPARLGAQTKSHTTAFAKDAELSQGAVRTVDYTDDTLLDPMTRLLELEYRMGVRNWRKQLVYVEAWDTYLELQKSHLPTEITWQALGAGATAEDQARMNQKLSAIQFAMQVDSFAVQLGREPRLDHGKIIDRVLEDAGFQDVTEIVADDNPVPDPAQDPQQPGVVTSNPELLQ